MKKRYFFDMDGVLCEFQRNCPLEIVFSPGYFKDLPVQLDVIELAKTLVDNKNNVYIISKAADFTIDDKKEWIKKYMPWFSLDKCIFVPLDKCKADYVPNGVDKNDILIDDYNPNLYEWKEFGGISVKLINTINHINKDFTSIYLDGGEVNHIILNTL